MRHAYIYIIIVYKVQLKSAPWCEIFSLCWRTIPIGGLCFLPFCQVGFSLKHFLLPFSISYNKYYVSYTVSLFRLYCKYGYFGGLFFCNFNIHNLTHLRYIRSTYHWCFCQHYFLRVGNLEEITGLWTNWMKELLHEKFPCVWFFL